VKDVTFSEGLKASYACMHTILTAIYSATRGLADCMSHLILVIHF